LLANLLGTKERRAILAGGKQRKTLELLEKKMHRERGIAREKSDGE